MICYKSELGSQLIAQREAEERAYCDYLEEKRQCDDMIAQIQEEDRIAREAELNKKEEQRQFIEKFKQEQAEWRANEIVSFIIFTAFNLFCSIRDVIKKKMSAWRDTKQKKINKKKKWQLKRLTIMRQKNSVKVSLPHFS